jgi:hypothetical protein
MNVFEVREAIAHLSDSQLRIIIILIVGDGKSFEDALTIAKSYHMPYP